MLDIYMNFRTGVLRGNHSLISSRPAIAGLYLRSWFLIDLVSSVPFDLLLASSPARGLVQLIKVCCWQRPSRESPACAAAVRRVGTCCSNSACYYMLVGCALLVSCLPIA